MVRLAPFRALRYDAAVAGPDLETSAPAYDELDRFSYTSHRTTNPYTVLELITGDHGARGDPFLSARATLERWQRTGVLIHDPIAALYLYEQHELRHGVPAVQRGIIGALDLQDLDDGALLLHEHIDPQRAQQRAERLAAVPLDLTPAVAIHAAGVGPDLPATLQMARVRAPLAAFTDEANIDHRLWRIDDPDTVARVQAAYEPVTAVLADGHHRVEAARRLRRTAGSTGATTSGWDATMVWLVDATADGPELRAVHRLARADPPVAPDGTPDLPGFRALPWTGGVPALEGSLAATPGLAFGLVTARGSWLLRAEDPDAIRAEAATAGPLLGALDAQVAAAAILPRLGDPPVEAVFEAERVAATLRHDERACLLLLRPPEVQQVMRIAAAGKRMPAKTTWFRPKPRAGLIMRLLSADDAS